MTKEELLEKANSLPLAPGEEELPLLACAGALLLLGIPPEELGQALS